MERGLPTNSTYVRPFTLYNIVYVRPLTLSTITSRMRIHYIRHKLPTLSMTT